MSNQATTATISYTSISDLRKATQALALLHQHHAAQGYATAPGIWEMFTEARSALAATRKAERQAEAAFDAGWAEGFTGAEYCSECGCESINPMGQLLSCNC